MAGKDMTKKMSCVGKKDDSKSGKGKKSKDLKDKKKERSGDDSNDAQQQCVMGKDPGSYGSMDGLCWEASEGNHDET